MLTRREFNQIKVILNELHRGISNEYDYISQKSVLLVLETFIIPEKKTVSCSEVWKCIHDIKESAKSETYSVSEQQVLNLENMFTDFECAWEQHAKEYHGED